MTLPADAENSPPSISPIPNLSTSEDTSTGSVPFMVTDKETPASSLIIAGSSSNTSLVPPANIVFAGSGTNRTIEITPAADQFGTTTITVIVADADGASASEAFIVTVNPVNDPPTLDPLPDLVVPENAAPQVVALTAISSGAPNESQTLSVTALSSATSVIPNPTITYISPNNAGTLTFAPLPNATGIVAITVTVNDGQISNNAFSRTFLVEVSPQPQHGIISFAAENYTVDEVAGTAVIRVTRTGGSDGIVAVQYRTLNGTAIPGLDYVAVSGVLTFASGETNKIFNIPIINDALVESDETVLLVLTNATGGATFPDGLLSTAATLTIMDSDGPAVPRLADCTTVLTFDDLSVGFDHIPMPQGYGGLQWSNFSVVNGWNQPWNSGYRTGMVSLNNVAFNPFGDPAAISGTNLFDFDSAYG